MNPQPTVEVLENQALAVPRLLDEVRQLRASGRRPVLGFATGGTFGPFLRALAAELQAGRIAAEALLCTHLDEYLGFAPEQPGGMVHELLQQCPPLRDMLARGSLLPVPADGSAASIAAHEERLRRAGGVDLQLLGIGRNGHLAFNEPGTPFDRGCHVTTLAATTRQDASSRFLPAEPPTQAVTSGLLTILAARRVVLCAFGASKAAAIAAMLLGPIDPACPASVLRRHNNARLLLDRDAASELRSQGFAGV